MLARSERGEIPPFDRAVIETTGLAEPGPILQAFMTEPSVARRFALDSVVTTVDAVNGAATLDRHVEAVKQAAVADRLLLTKTDLSEPGPCLALERRLTTLNPTAPIIRTHPGTAIDAASLFDLGLYGSSGNGAAVRRWLGLEDGGAAAGSSARHHPHAHDASRHDAHIRAVCLTFDEPIAGEALDRWLGSLLRLRGPDLLRFKAIVNVAELPGPLVLHGVQHVIHPPTMLKTWPSDDRRTRMVFITYDIDEAALRSSLQELAAVPV
jgi:G3E family GTPase